MKNLLLSVLLLMGAKFNSLFATEAFLPRDISEFENTNQIVYSKYLNKDANLYICNENTFDNLFPKKLSDNFRDESVFVGQIVNKSGDGIGSGTLFDVEEQNNVIIGTGFTALHVFCSLNSTRGLSINSDCSFIIGRKAIQNNSAKSTFLGHVSIDQVLIQKNFSKDICLFKGQVAYETDIFNSAQDFVAFFKRHKPKLAPRELIVLDQDVRMYHYPAAKKDLRVNTGVLIDEITHNIRTLGGSSGAAIFDYTTYNRPQPSYIVGIHVGQKENAADTRKIIRYYPPLSDSWLWFWLPDSWRSDYHEFPIMVRPANKFELFSRSDYNKFINEDTNLYDLSPDQKDDFHIALIKKIRGY